MRETVQTGGNIEFRYTEKDLERIRGSSGSDAFKASLREHNYRMAQRRVFLKKVKMFGAAFVAVLAIVLAVLVFTN